MTDTIVHVPTNTIGVTEVVFIVSMNPDIQAYYQAQKDHKRIHHLARNWVSKGKHPDAFIEAIRKVWPTGYARLGDKKVRAAIALAKGGF